MNKSFRTELATEKSAIEIEYQSSVMMLGSCFSDHIGSLLQKNKFSVHLNPFGVLYNPASIAQLLFLVLRNGQINLSGLTHFNNQWHSLLLHGSFSDSNADVLIRQANKAIRNTREVLANTNILFITFGTSWVYQWKASNEIVANCHKIPASQFHRFRLTLEEIVTEWTLLIEHLKNFNPALKIIFTVSPVRHLKDGLHENQLSKATLLLAIDQLIKQDQTNKLAYFPSYEMVQDDLRDYRFYAEDMLHISDQAVHYIYEKFQNVFFSQQTVQTSKDIHSIVQLKEHRLLSKNPIEIVKFAELALKKIDLFKEKYPHVKFELEKNYFENIIQTNRLL
ncbi:MAG: GSCFA domain-containing protein [Prolixibacteraceae bacterium]